MSHPDGLPDLFLDRSLGRVRVPSLLRAAGLRLVTLSERYGVPADERIPDHWWLGEAGARDEAVFMTPVGDGDHGLADRDPPVGQVDVAPPQPQHLATAHPRVGGEDIGGSQPVGLDEGQEGLQLRRGPHPHLLLRAIGPRSSRRIGRGGRVPRDRALPECIVERLAQDPMDVANAGRTQPAPGPVAPARVE